MISSVIGVISGILDFYLQRMNTKVHELQIIGNDTCGKYMHFTGVEISTAVFVILYDKSYWSGSLRISRH